MKLLINISSKRILTFAFICSILFQLFIPILIFRSSNSTVKLPGTITNVNYFSHSENLVESTARKIERNNSSKISEIKNYHVQDFILLKGDFYTHTLFHKYLKYAEKELIVRNFYTYSFCLRSPPISLS